MYMTVTARFHAKKLASAVDRNHTEMATRMAIIAGVATNPML
jgi:hypothetical protein